VDGFKKRPHLKRQPSLASMPAPAPALQDIVLPITQPDPIVPLSPGGEPRKSTNKKKIILISCIGFLVALISIAASGFIWYSVQLSAVGTDQGQLLQVTIRSGATPAEIGDTLKQKGLIRSTEAFAIYTRLTGTQNKLQAGGYRLSPAETTPQIVEHLTEGNVDTFSIRFLPGATLAQHRDVLINAGYSEEDVTKGLLGSYDSPLFSGKPAMADLEGYIYGETYSFSTSATVGDILKRTFQQYEKVMKENDLVKKFAKQGLSLYEGITLASIIQREAIGGDEPQIAQVFYSRIAIGMQLGSDVTYQYIADKTGVQRDTNLDSPYNTRRYTGLPPGPIATPGVRSLLAVASPASGDYLYFLSGDDDITYYGRTLTEHEANIVAHCKVKCSII
jgi:UPF0755 protein